MPSAALLPSLGGFVARSPKPAAPPAAGAPGPDAGEGWGWEEIAREEGDRQPARPNTPSSASSLSVVSGLSGGSSELDDMLAAPAAADNAPPVAAARPGPPAPPAAARAPGLWGRLAEAWPPWPPQQIADWAHNPNNWGDGWASQNSGRQVAGQLARDRLMAHAQQAFVLQRRGELGAARTLWRDLAVDCAEQDLSPRMFLWQAPLLSPPSTPSLSVRDEGGATSGTVTPIAVEADGAPDPLQHALRHGLSVGLVGSLLALLVADDTQGQGHAVPGALSSHQFAGYLQDAQGWLLSFGRAAAKQCRQRADAKTLQQLQVLKAASLTASLLLKLAPEGQEPPRFANLGQYVFPELAGGAGAIDRLTKRRCVKARNFLFAQDAALRADYIQAIHGVTVAAIRNGAFEEAGRHSERLGTLLRETGCVVPAEPKRWAEVLYAMKGVSFLSATTPWDDGERKKRRPSLPLLADSEPGACLALDPRLHEGRRASTDPRFAWGPRPKKRGAGQGAERAAACQLGAAAEVPQPLHVAWLKATQETVPDPWLAWASTFGLSLTQLSVGHKDFVAGPPPAQTQGKLPASGVPQAPENLRLYLGAPPTPTSAAPVLQWALSGPNAYMVGGLWDLAWSPAAATVLQEALSEGKGRRAQAACAFLRGLYGRGAPAPEALTQKLTATDLTAAWRQGRTPERLEDEVFAWLWP